MLPLTAMSQAIAPALGYAGFATVSKALGSGFRVAADRKAPTEVRANTIKREASMLGLVFAFNTAVQMASQKLKMNPTASLLLTLPSTAVAEWASRKIGHNPDWNALLTHPPEQAADAFQKLSSLTVKDMPFANRLEVIGDIGKHVVASATGRLSRANETPVETAFAAARPAAANPNSIVSNPFAAGYNNTVQSPLLGFSGRSGQH